MIWPRSLLVGSPPPLHRQHPWPDEDEVTSYPHRFTFEVLGEWQNVALTPGLLGPSAIEGLRKARAGGQGVVADADGDVFQELNVASDSVVERDSALRDRIGKINRSPQAYGPAPYKPLLLLLALARAQHGSPRLAPFSEYEEPLKELLVSFGEGNTQNAARPFWHLQNDGLWEVVRERRRDHRAQNPARRSADGCPAGSGFLAATLGPDSGRRQGRVLAHDPLDSARSPAGSDKGVRGQLFEGSRSDRPRDGLGFRHNGAPAALLSETVKHCRRWIGPHTLGDGP